MTPKEKAKELVEKYFNTLHKSSDLELSWKVCKKCALISVDEIMQAISNVLPYGMQYLSAIDYLELVKQEIELL